MSLGFIRFVSLFLVLPIFGLTEHEVNIDQVVVFFVGNTVQPLS